MKLADLYMFLKPDIKKIESELERAVEADHPVLREASLHLLHSGGKRIRPVFVLLSAKFGHYEIDRVKYIAAALELIHMASLVHDDVIDDADLRRGSKTIKARWDNRVAMYTGDYIFAKAIEKASFFENETIHRVISNAMMEMCLGEIEQIRDQYNWDQNFKTYLRRIKRKTALLIAVSCQLGAISAGASRKDQNRLYYYGYNVGMSYQIIDDILDFTGTEKELGKPAGGDLKQGNVTLPALYAMHHDPFCREEINRIIGANGDEPGDISPLLDMINRSGGIEYSKTLSRQYLEKAFRSLDELEDISAKKSLLDIASYIGSRSS
ncbi:heptaprenyl diphosphate synthase component II [Salibacterium halotolerans]|uniref:Heptaprenyl diphosphate synthase component 2 n=1 Tax=Salibacterium halotolerans TaxID=1884432 RepID=A0A1I5Q6W4_9BACI|nr:heptaprenyl diphosphate synthase component II [Salibacterium halotolerans]SFP41616.1 heptaprenyl diphosphate synthase [Salibacterium halotolerans]